MPINVIIKEVYRVEGTAIAFTLVPSNPRIEPMQVKISTKDNNQFDRLQENQVWSIKDKNVWFNKRVHIDALKTAKIDETGITIEKSKFTAPICVTGLALVNSDNEVFLAKNASVGMINFIYLVDNLLQKKTTIHDPKVKDELERVFKQIPREEYKKLSCGAGIKEIFSCYLNKERNQSKLEELVVMIKLLLDLVEFEEKGDDEDTKFANFSFIKGGLSNLRKQTQNKSFIGKKLSKLQTELTGGQIVDLEKYYYLNAFKEFEEEISQGNELSSSVFQKNPKPSVFVDLPIMTLGKRGSPKPHRLSQMTLQRIYFVRVANTSIGVKKGGEYNLSDSKFYSSQDILPRLPLCAREKFDAAFKRFLGLEKQVEI